MLNRVGFPTFVELVKEQVGTMKGDSFRVLFFLKKTKLLKHGEAPSACITVNGTHMHPALFAWHDPVISRQGSSLRDWHASGKRCILPIEGVRDV